VCRTLEDLSIDEFVGRNHKKMCPIQKVGRYLIYKYKEKLFVQRKQLHAYSCTSRTVNATIKERYAYLGPFKEVNDVVIRLGSPDQVLKTQLAGNSV